MLHLKLWRRIKGTGRTYCVGVSNISFGLPQREIITSAFFTMAMQAGLSAGIVNPNSQAMMQAYDTFRVLGGYDAQCMSYVEKYSAMRLYLLQSRQAKPQINLKRKPQEAHLAVWI